MPAIGVRTPTPGARRSLEAPLTRALQPIHQLLSVGTASGSCGRAVRTVSFPHPVGWCGGRVSQSPTPVSHTARNGRIWRPVPCPVHDDGGRLLDSRARILLVTTAFFSTTATVIPVLLIAGILSPAVLRDYSRYRKTAVLLEIQIGTALLGTIAAIIGVVLSGGEGAPQWAIVAAYVLTWSGIVTGIGFLFLTAHTALHEHPHPDRLQSQANDIRNRLALIESRQSQQSVEEAQY